MTGKGKKYKAPEEIIKFYNMTRKEWLKLSRGEKTSLASKFMWINRKKEISKNISKGKIEGSKIIRSLSKNRV